MKKLFNNELTSSVELALKSRSIHMLGIRFELITINNSVMKIRMECVTAQKAAAPLNKNDSRISRNHFVAFRDAVFKLQKF